MAILYYFMFSNLWIRCGIKKYLSRVLRFDTVAKKCIKKESSINQKRDIFRIVDPKVHDPVASCLRQGTQPGYLDSHATLLTNQNNGCVGDLNWIIERGTFMCSALVSAY